MMAAYRSLYRYMCAILFNNNSIVVLLLPELLAILFNILGLIRAYTC